ncbi:MAG: transglycosylase domain-containing protein, partial [Rhizobiaceae bacterium]
KQRSLVVKTTVDTDLQNAAEESSEFHLRQFGEEYKVTQSAIVMIETDGSVRAMVGGRDYGASQFNRATNALRQAGSSFKPYVYATAMENGYDAESIVADVPVSWGSWSPQNYSRSYSGRINLTTALVKSINTVPVRLAQQLKTTSIAAMAKAMGIESEISLHKTMSLGTSEITVLDQATGYHTFLANGFAGKRHSFTQIYSHTGDLLWERSKDSVEPQKVLSDQAVASMNTILAQVPEWGTGRRASVPGMRVAGKTGTTQSYRDAWFVGYTGNYVAAVWFGNDDFSATENLTGGLLPAMTWQRLMSYAHQNIELLPIPGLEQPFPVEEPRPEEKSVEKPEDSKEQELLDQRKRPVVLNAETMKLLLKMQEQFESAPALSVSEDLSVSSIGAN